MNASKATGIYALLDTRTGEFLRFGTKTAWHTKQAAGIAYTFHMCSYYNKLPKFSEQSDVIVVDLLEHYQMYKELQK